MLTLKKVPPRSRVEVSSALRRSVLLPVGLYRVANNVRREVAWTSITRVRFARRY